MRPKGELTPIREIIADMATTQPALERLWTQHEAAAYLGVSERYLRASDCPKLLLPGTGPMKKPLVRYAPADVRAWAEGYRVTRRFA